MKKYDQSHPCVFPRFTAAACFCRFLANWLDQEYFLISAKNKRVGGIHASRETRRTCGEHRKLIFGAPRAMRVFRPLPYFSLKVGTIHSLLIG